ncbi:hypothetical protein RHO13_02195 [Orbus wheelerorum]|uniref:hypothetical protein n=1 Tax=Orbus wheelerorum TaxID=3074111 RepID=UPI00370DA73B
MNNSHSNKLPIKLENAYAEFKKCLAIIDCKPKHFFERYYQDVIDDRDDDIEANRFYEKHKKKLQRKTHKLDELTNFINYITQLDEFNRKGWVKPVCISDGTFGAQFESAMKDISKLVTKMVNQD